MLLHGRLFEIVLIAFVLTAGLTTRTLSQQIGQLPTEIAENERRVFSAIELAAPPVLDGHLDDAVWRNNAPETGFVQAEPFEGSEASRRTEVWVAFTSDNIYVAAYLHDDPDGIVVSDIRKDFRTDNQDVFEIILDTFGDRRNGYVFSTNPGGGRADQQVTNEGREINSSWDAPWDVRTQLVADGWTLEMVIPMNSIRSSTDENPVWGINFSRRIRRNNEIVYWAPIPRAFALTRLSLAGNLVGLNSIRRSRNLRATPYVLGRTVRQVGGLSFEEKVDGGVDVKYGVTNGLTLDVTVNPDFAQAEADEQQVNLTQFSQFFPEKRDFFLENSGLFYIGDTPRNTRIATAPRGNEDLLLFFSRRMGLAADGTPIPITGGVRLTGQQSGVQIGALGLRTKALGTTPSNDYAVVRLRRNVMNNSDVGVLFMTRSAVGGGGNFNRLYGVDANIRLFGRVDWSSFFIQSDSPGVTGPRYAYQTSLNREGNYLHVKAGLLSIGENFNDELGFLRRTGIMKWSTDIGIRPRPEAMRRLGVREMHPHIVWNYFTDQSFNKVAMRLHTGYTFFLSNGGFSELSANPTTETLLNPLTLHPDAEPVPVGVHDWNEWMFRYNTDASRMFSVSFTGILGGLWNGTQRTVRTSVTFKPSFKFRADLGLSRTNADLPGVGGQFAREIWTARANYSFTSNMFIDGLAQYNAASEAVNLNVRFNLIHSPLSNLFIVYNEQRFATLGAPVPGRSLVLKATQMLSF